jgi:hypothetical protein
VIEEIVEHKLLLRYLIDNARSSSANLTDNELVTLLMSLHGFSQGEIARVLVKTSGQGQMRSSRVQQLRKQAFDKTLHVSGLDEIDLFTKKGNAMPRGVYPRQPKSEPEPAPNGAHDLVADVEHTVEDYDDTPSITQDTHEPWGQPYEVAASHIKDGRMKWDGLYEDVLLRLEVTPASRAIIYPFASVDDAEKAYAALRKRFNKHDDGFVICGVRRTPPRVFVRRGPDYKKG